MLANIVNFAAILVEAVKYSHEASVHRHSNRAG